MNPGDLNRSVLIQTIDESRDAFGASIQTWIELATVWAQIEPLSGGESFVSDMIQSRATHRFTIYHRTDVTAEERIVYGGFAYDILLVQSARNAAPNEALELIVQWTNETVSLVAGDGLVDFDGGDLETFAAEPMEVF
jgi:SPP1 family predicted phage head-tail adaptor